MSTRQFLFLQGPHGPFFGQLAGLLKAAGHAVHKIGINAGDGFYWPHKEDYTAYPGDREDWSFFLAEFLHRVEVTDLVLYGDTRDIHAVAITLARHKGITVHCFEEGYLRPYWITYERGGANANSPLMDLSLDQMRDALGGNPGPCEGVPGQWGALWHHMAHGAIYHFCVMFANWRYPGYRSHRRISVAREWWLHVKRMIQMPFHAAARVRAFRRLRGSGANFHLVLLQLTHDASFRDHSNFRSLREFVDMCCRGFAAGAPGHAQLVFKAHPLEDGREPLDPIIRAAATRYRIADRVQIVRGGRLGEMLDLSSGVVTVNSTAAQQALWRGLPLKAFGRSVYSRPEFLSAQSLPDFFAAPERPDVAAYQIYRQFLLATSQIRGGFYTAAGRGEALRNLLPVILEDRDPYAIVPKSGAARLLHLVREETG